MDQLAASPEFISALIALVVACGSLITAYAKYLELKTAHTQLQGQVNGGVDQRMAAAMQAGLTVHAATGDPAAAAAAAASASHALAVQQGAATPALAPPPGGPRPPVVTPPTAAPGPAAAGASGAPQDKQQQGG